MKENFKGLTIVGHRYPLGEHILHYYKTYLITFLKKIVSIVIKLHRSRVSTTSSYHQNAGLITRMYSCG